MSDLIGALHGIVGAERCLSRAEELFVYECDALTLDRATPAAVVFPHSAGEVQEIVRACRAHDSSFVPRGAGTGHCVDLRSFFGPYRPSGRTAPRSP